MEWLLAGATLLGGIGALAYFWDKLKPFATRTVRLALRRNSGRGIHEAPAAVRTSEHPPATEAKQKVEAILKWKDKPITLAQMNSGKAAHLLGAVRARSAVTLLDCNELFVTVACGDSSRSIPLCNLDVSFDNLTGRLELQERV